MAEPKQLSELEIARETLRGLVSRKIPPTPDNYRALYLEISGAPAVATFPEREFKALLANLPRTSPEQNRFARQFEGAIAADDCTLVGHVLITAPFAEGPVVLDLTLVSGDVVATNRYHTTVIAT